MVYVFIFRNPASAHKHAPLVDSVQKPHLSISDILDEDGIRFRSSKLGSSSSSSSACRSRVLFAPPSRRPISEQIQLTPVLESHRPHPALCACLGDTPSDTGGDGGMYEDEEAAGEGVVCMPMLTLMLGEGMTIAAGDLAA